VYYKESKAYMKATHNAIGEERMAIVIQEVTGTAHGEKFYPNLSGVARSLNFYPIEPEKTDDGIANIALGLGKHVVEGKPSVRFSPKYPKKLLQLSTPEMAIKETQKTFYALDLNPSSFKPSTNDGVNILELGIKNAIADGTLEACGSTYDFENQRISDGYTGKGVPIVSFAPILKHKLFPLPEILQNILKIGQLEMNNPVEIEFAVNLNTPADKPKIFSMLQIRPIAQNRDIINADFDSLKKSDMVLYSP
ncbi:MAG TPA: phosphoenolpyruvate synthase, partial [Bacteroidales bacterium]|nr:phosphoenolpyruvate synthase [Bacteroidales bacterium]